MYILLFTIFIWDIYDFYRLFFIFLFFIFIYIYIFSEFAQYIHIQLILKFCDMLNIVVKMIVECFRPNKTLKSRGIKFKQ